MKKRDIAELNRYVRWLANELELRDWTVTVDIAEPDSPDHPDNLQWGASSDSIYGRKSVTITIDPACRTWPLEALRCTVAHELIHAHFAQVWEMVRLDLQQHLGQATYDVFVDGFRRWLEFGVDAMADATAKHLPVITWPKTKGKS